MTLSLFMLQKDMEWSVIDRWPTHPKFIRAVVANIQQAIARFPVERQSDITVLFSAHSLPLRVSSCLPDCLRPCSAIVRSIVGLVSSSSHLVMATSSCCVDNGKG